jgi:hypothetical protein
LPSFACAANKEQREKSDQHFRHLILLSIVLRQRLQ